MRKLFAVTAILLTAALPSAFGQNSAKGTWTCDPAQSDFGSQPKPKSIRLVVTKDTPAMLAWHLTEVGADGKTSKESWSGPEDGSMHPLKSAEMKSEWSFKREGDDMIRQAKMADGATVESHISTSDGGDTMTEHVTGTGKDGKQFTATVVWRRVKATKKPAS